MLRRFWSNLLVDWNSRFGLFIIILAVSVALLAPVISPESPTALGDDIMASPSSSHWLGTDDLGRDILSQLIWGTRTSLLFASAATFLTLVVGIILGSIPGYYGGFVDHAFSRFFEVFLMMPQLFLIILLAAIFGQNIWLAAIVVGLTIWPPNARLIRAQTLTVKSREYVEAARAAGASDMRILFRHILPNSVQPVIVNSTLLMASAILIEASLSFLGLGDPNVTSWGRMLQRSQSYIESGWWMAVFPGLAISFLVLGISLVGEGINRAMNVQLITRQKKKRAESESGITGQGVRTTEAV